MDKLKHSLNYEFGFEIDFTKCSINNNRIKEILRKPSKIDWKTKCKYDSFNEKVFNVCPIYYKIYYLIRRQTSNLDENFVEKFIINRKNHLYYTFSKKEIKFLFTECIIQDVKLTENFLDKNVDYIDFNNENIFNLKNTLDEILSENFIRKYYKRFRNHYDRLYSSFDFSPEFLIEFLDDTKKNIFTKSSDYYLNEETWDVITTTQKLPLILIEKYINKINWQLIPNIDFETFPEHLFEKIHKKLNWGMFSRIESIPLYVFLNYTKHILWDENILSKTESNKLLLYPKFIDFILKCKENTDLNYKIILISIYLSASILPSDETIIAFSDEIYFEDLSMKKDVIFSDNIIEKFSNRFDWQYLTCRGYQKISNKMLEKYAYKIDESSLWSEALEICEFSESVLDKYFEKFSPKDLVKIQTKFEISEDFMEKHYTDLNMNYCIHTQRLSYNFIQKMNLTELIQENLEINKYSLKIHKITEKAICDECEHYHEVGSICNICDHWRLPKDFIEDSESDVLNVIDFDYCSNMKKFSAMYNNYFNYVGGRSNTTSKHAQFKFDINAKFYVEDLIENVYYNASLSFKYLLCTHNSESGELFLKDAINCNKNIKIHCLYILYNTRKIQMWTKQILYKPGGKFFEQLKQEFYNLANQITN